MLFRRSALLLLLIAGCGDSLGYKLAPVKGTVKLDGTPLGGAHVEFVPEGQTTGIGAIGVSEADGSFKLNNKHGGVGAAPGEYRVVVSIPGQPGGGAAAAADPGAAKSVSDKKVPAVYASRESSPLRATVPAAGGVIDLELSSSPAAK
jgi:hypothetical protein